MIIACAINNDYIRHCAVMLRSLWDFNPRDDLTVFVVHSDLDSQERGRLVAYLNDFLPSVSFLHVDDTVLEGFPESDHVKLPSYYRLFFPEILPGFVDRVIYLDSDLIVNGSLDKFWSMSLDGYLLAAATDRNLDMQRERLGLAPESPYFNAGVMTLNLSEWRQLDVAARGLAYAKKYPEKLPNCDQDVLNHLFENRCLLVHQRWNAMPHLWGLDQQWLAEQGGLSEEEVEAHADPVIVHFAGAGFAKPWHAACPHPWKERYRAVLAETPWAGTSLEGAPVEPGLLRKSVRRIRNGLARLSP